MLYHSLKDLSELHMYTVLYKFLDMFPMIKVLLSGVEPTFEAILAVFHGNLVWYLGGIVNGVCVMDIRRIFLIRYMGPLNSKHIPHLYRFQWPHSRLP